MPAVAGVPDEDWGELVTAFVVLRSRAARWTWPRCGATARDGWPRPSIPDGSSEVDAIPRTGATRQIQRRVLVEWALASSDGARRRPTSASDVRPMRTSAGYGLGIVSVAFGLDCPLPEAAGRARPSASTTSTSPTDRLPEGVEETLAITVGDRNGPVPQTGCTCRLPQGCTWDECVALLRQPARPPGRAWSRSVLDSAAAIRGMCQEVPGLRITLDTGWAAFCGYDPLEVADWPDTSSCVRPDRAIPRSTRTRRGTWTSPA